ncbi:MAG TPA: tyrosine-type recombinase/integrase [Vampirovibrionales bacterium]
MSKQFQILTRNKQRQLKPNQKLQEHGIIFTRLPNGDGRYSVCIMVDGQRVHRIVGNESTGTTREQAFDFIAKVKIEAKEQRLNLPKGRKLQMSFKEAATQYLERLKDEKDFKCKERRIRLHLMPFFKTYPLSKICPFDIERYKKKRQTDPLKTRVKGLTKPSTINRELAILSNLFNKALEWGWIEKGPCKIKKFKEDNQRTVYLTSDQIRRVLEIAKEDINPHIYPYMFIALNTAMRHMEILRLRKGDIDFDRMIIKIHEAKAGAREQPLSVELSEFLKNFVEFRSGYLFPSPKSSTGHLKEIRKPFIRVVSIAGLDPKQVVRHTLRHTVITHLVQAGVDLPTVKRISGHKTLIMVERYSHQNTEHIQSAFDRLRERVG